MTSLSDCVLATDEVYVNQRNKQKRNFTFFVAYLHSKETIKKGAKGRGREKKKGEGGTSSERVEEVVRGWGK